MNKKDILLGILSIHQNTINQEVILNNVKEFEDKCRSVHITELGHIIFITENKILSNIAQKILMERLKNNNIEGKPNIKT